MTDREETVQKLSRMADIAQGLSKATMIMGMNRDKFVKLMRSAAEEIGKVTTTTVPYQSECPKCGNTVTFVTLNGERRVMWHEQQTGSKGGSGED